MISSNYYDWTWILYPILFTENEMLKSLKKKKNLYYLFCDKLKLNFCIQKLK